MEELILIKDAFPYREYQYKDDKIVEYGKGDFVGFYLNADEEIQSVKGRTLEEVCKRLDEYNSIVNNIKEEENYG